MTSKTLVTMIMNLIITKSIQKLASSSIRKIFQKNSRPNGMRNKRLPLRSSRSKSKRTKKNGRAITGVDLESFSSV